MSVEAGFMVDYDHPRFGWVRCSVERVEPDIRTTISGRRVRLDDRVYLRVPGQGRLHRTTDHRIETSAFYRALQPTLFA